MPGNRILSPVRHSRGAFTPRQTRDATKMEYGDGSAGVSQTVNYLGLVVLLLVQWWISRTLLRVAGRIGAPPEIFLLRPRKA